MPWFLNEECRRWYSQPTLGGGALDIYWDINEILFGMIVNVIFVIVSSQHTV